MVELHREILRERLQYVYPYHLWLQFSGCAALQSWHILQPCSQDGHCPHPSCGKMQPTFLVTQSSRLKTCRSILLPLLPLPIGNQWVLRFCSDLHIGNICAMNTETQAGHRIASQLSHSPAEVRWLPALIQHAPDTQNAGQGQSLKWSVIGFQQHI